MSDLYHCIKTDIVEMVKNRYSSKIVNFLKVIISDIQRDPNKDYSDEKVIKILNQTKKSLLEMKNYGKDVSEELRLIDNYLPKKLSENEIRNELNKIDFSKLKNKMQAIGILKQKFGEKIDPIIVKEIILNEF